MEFAYNGKTYHIHIDSVSVYPQGYCAVYDKLRDMDGVNMIADIGNGTMNILKVIDHKCIIDSCRTEKLGVEKCVFRIRNAVMNKFHEEIDESIIRKFFKDEEQELPEEYRKVMESCTTEYCKDILTALYNNEYNSKFMKLYVVGGGAVVMSNHNTNTPNTTFITDICANAKGYEFQAKRNLRKCADGKDNKSQA